ncbi:hypothetical protein [Streptomyces sp. NPDC058335]|uniref:hypothetical protein n=1 Tax=Streptomyces sp. NPDC058335 TaxID=3346451 RepID=UPI00365E1738
MKRVRVTDTELAPGRTRSTANLSGPPPFCHYGIGDIPSPGATAWREPAVHTMTAGWVLSGRLPNLP